jgi:peptide/nickel transport system substrate-binding protein
MQAQLKKIGVNMKMDIEENTVVYTKRVAGNFQASFSQIQSGLPDPTQFLIDYLTPNGQTNPGHLTIPGIEKDVATLQSSTDEATQAAAMADASTKALQAGTPVIPICSDQVSTGFKSNVHGVTIPIDYDFDLSTISMS